MKFQELEQIFKNKKNLLIFMHDNPDPDSICSSVLLKTIANKFNIKSYIVYGGEISRSENLSMLKLLNIKVYSFVSGQEKDYDLTALVDTQKNTGNNSFPAEIIPDITFDHHPMKKSIQNFYDIQTDYGSTASIIFTYFLYYNLPVTSQIATAFCYALVSDTNYFTRHVNDKDIDLYKKVIAKADIKIISNITNSQKSKDYYNTLKLALNNYQINNKIIYCTLGKIKNIEFIPEIAEVLAKMENTHISVVIGYTNKNTKISTRTNLHGLSLGKLVAETLKGLGKGGGHDMMASGFFNSSCDENKVLNIFLEKAANLLKNIQD